jgi:hypothetical protein
LKRGPTLFATLRLLTIILVDIRNLGCHEPWNA